MCGLYIYQNWSITPYFHPQAPLALWPLPPQFLNVFNRCLYKVVNLEKKFKCNATQNEDTTKVDPTWFGKEPKAFVKDFLLFAKENWLTIKLKN